jgi:hypothetical protein
MPVGAGYETEHWRNTPPLGAEYFDAEAFAEADAKHVGAVMRLGGYPRAVIDQLGRAELLGPDNRPWQQALRRRLAKTRRAR